MTQEVTRIGILHLSSDPLSDLYDYVIQMGAVPKIISPMEGVPTDCNLVIVTDCGLIPSPMDSAYVNGQTISVIATANHMTNFMVSSFFDAKLEEYLAKNIPLAFFGNSATFAAAALNGKLEVVNEFSGRCSILGQLPQGTNMIGVEDEICTSEVTIKAKILTLPRPFEPCMWYTRATRTQFGQLETAEEKENARAYPIAWINTIGKIFICQTLPWLLKNNVKSLNKIRFNFNSGDPFSNNFLKYLLHAQKNTIGDETIQVE